MLFKEDEAARAEARAIRENAGWYRWTHDLVEVQGPDAGRFAQHLFVSDMGKVPVGRSKYTTMLNEDGKIMLTTNREVNDFLRMLNDDFLVSPLSQAEYEARSKKPLRRDDE